MAWPLQTAPANGPVVVKTLTGLPVCCSGAELPYLPISVRGSEWSLKKEKNCLFAFEYLGLMTFLG